MLGGIEYWIREGLPVDTGEGSSSVLPIRSPRRSRRWLAIAELWPELQRLSGQG
jgi:hypothetical protein